MEVAYSGQARSLVYADNGTLHLHRLDDSYFGPVTAASLPIIFDGCSDVRLANVESVGQAIDLSLMSWMAHRTILHLGLLIKITEGENSFQPTKQSLDYCLDEISRNLHDQDILNFVQSSIYLEAIFFKINQSHLLSLIDLPEKVATLTSRPLAIENLVKATRVCIPIVTLISTVLEKLYGDNHDRKDRLYRLLSRSGLMGDLIWAMVEEVRNLNFKRNNVTTIHTSHNRDLVQTTLLNYALSSNRSVHRDLHDFLYEINTELEELIFPNTDYRPNPIPSQVSLSSDGYVKVEGKSVLQIGLDKMQMLDKVL